MQIFRDLMDNQVTDRCGLKMGKVDGVVLVLRRGRPPRVSAIELGARTLGARIHPSVGAWATRLARWAGVSDGAPQRIDIRRITGIGIDVRVDIDARRTAVFDWERWVRGTFIGRIPGSGQQPEGTERK